MLKPPPSTLPTMRLPCYHIVLEIILHDLIYAQQNPLWTVSRGDVASNILYILTTIQSGLVVNAKIGRRKTGGPATRKPLVISRSDITACTERGQRSKAIVFSTLWWFDSTRRISITRAYRDSRQNTTPNASILLLQLLGAVKQYVFLAMGPWINRHGRALWGNLLV